MSEKNHELFKKKMEVSKRAKKVVAFWLYEQGVSVKLNPSAVAPTYGERFKYSDSGDLEICYRAKVKKLNAKFTNAADWPFPEFMVCMKSAFDRANPKPYIFYYLSRCEGAVAVLRADTNRHWYAKKTEDKTYPDRLVQEFYYCPIEYVTWHTIEEKLPEDDGVIPEGYVRPETAKLFKSTGGQ